MRTKLSWVAGTALLVSVVGCGGGSDDGDSVDPNNVGVNGMLTNVAADLDTDGDGIFDVDEGTGDPNMNGYPAHRDASEGFSDPTRDLDNDGVPDITEGAGDANMNGIPAYRDPTEQGSVEDAGGATGGTTGGATGTTGGSAPATTAGAGGGGLATGSACTAVDTCADVSLLNMSFAGCCTSAGICGGEDSLTGQGCVTSVMCSGSGFVPCFGPNPCCTAEGACGDFEADGVTCTASEPIGGGTTGGATGATTAGTNAGTTGDGGAGTTGAAAGECPSLDVPMLGMQAGCCTAGGMCGINNPLGGGCTTLADLAASVGMTGAGGTAQACTP